MGRHRVSVVDDPYRPSKWATRGLTALFLVVALGSVLALVPSNYVILKPGPTTNILGRGEGSKPIVTISGHASYPARGHLNFTTVRQVGANVMEVEGCVIGGLLCDEQRWTRVGG